MPTCTRNGCRKDYEVGSSETCFHHSGNPVFHEGSKSWSCCNETNKPVLDFDDFVKIPGCTSAENHAEERISVKKDQDNSIKDAAKNAVPLKLSKGTDGSEVYTTSVQKKVDLPTAMAQSSTSSSFVVEEDDLSVPIAMGTKCQRKGCDYKFVSEEESRIGSGAECHFHPAPPLFREGSKGYLCCKRRVLEFDEFLKIPGCTKGTHLFVSKSSREQPLETNVTCRLDHYQTPKEVFVSVFAKHSDREKSKIVIEKDQLYLDVYMPEGKRFQKVVMLYGPVDVAQSAFQFLNTKIEIKLVKQDGRSWNLLEKTGGTTSELNLTFGVGGRLGTGAKEMILGAENRPLSS